MTGNAIREALEPCPFCGGPAHSTPEVGELAALVMCSENDCCTLSGATLQAVIAAWNRRDRTAYDAIGSKVKAAAITAAMVSAFYEATEVTRQGSIRNIKEGLAAAISCLSPVEADAKAGEELFLIRKRGAYYRQNEQGYTSSIAEAGRYSREDAERITHPNGPDGPRDGMDYVPALSTPSPQIGKAGAGPVGDATDAMIEAGLKVDMTNEDERGYLHNVWHAMVAAHPTAAGPVGEAVAWQSGLDAGQIETLRSNGLKPEEIAGDPSKQEARVRELLRWFVRFADGDANPKWATMHAFELAYFIAIRPVEEPGEVERLTRERDEAQARSLASETNSELLQSELADAIRRGEDQWAGWVQEQVARKAAVVRAETAESQLTTAEAALAESEQNAQGLASDLAGTQAALTAALESKTRLVEALREIAKPGVGAAADWSLEECERYWFNQTRSQRAAACAALSTPAPAEIESSPVEAEAGPVGEAVAFVMQYGGRCRDCADCNGYCQDEGLPCEPKHAERIVRYVLKAVEYGRAHGFISSPERDGASREEWMVAYASSELKRERLEKERNEAEVNENRATQECLIANAILNRSYIAMRDAMKLIDPNEGPGHKHSDALNALAQARVEIERHNAARAALTGDAQEAGE